ncbi:chemotaxis protein CheD [Aliiruegeria sabulilitoris]|uniref:chemotaxis protein CheD n=1 Tax=Aliiruegeria sabulilitoris TaxID=1510458 RepID=UPI0008301451|nr:chemotaxis protein CheD [Aliiruegeria sabulilitoris]NDR56127.1 chemotaxis protein CheD [Pseudoruegeria sp. M32A2M]
MRTNVLHVTQGEHAVSACTETYITTLLGSCVSTCLWDPYAGLGGLNHILVPDGKSGDITSRSIGTNAMELLINDLLRHGARKNRLQAKLFGGARMISGLSDIGQANAKFAEDFCRREGIPCLASSLGGTQGRRIQFWPVTGKVRQQFLQAVPEEKIDIPPKPHRPNTTEIELF